MMKDDFASFFLIKEYFIQKRNSEKQFQEIFSLKFSDDKFIETPLFFSFIRNRLKVLWEIRRKKLN